MGYILAWFKKVKKRGSTSLQWLWHVPTKYHNTLNIHCCIIHTFSYTLSSQHTTILFRTGFCSYHKEKHPSAFQSLQQNQHIPACNATFISIPLTITAWKITYATMNTWIQISNAFRRLWLKLNVTDCKSITYRGTDSITALLGKSLSFLKAKVVFLKCQIIWMQRDFEFFSFVVKWLRLQADSMGKWHFNAHNQGFIL